MNAPDSTAAFAQRRPAQRNNVRWDNMSSFRVFPTQPPAAIVPPERSEGILIIATTTQHPPLNLALRRSSPHSS